MDTVDIKNAATIIFSGEDVSLVSIHRVGFAAIEPGVEEFAVALQYGDMNATSEKFGDDRESAEKRFNEIVSLVREATKEYGDFERSTWGLGYSLDCKNKAQYDAWKKAAGFENNFN